MLRAGFDFDFFLGFWQAHGGRVSLPIWMEESSTLKVKILIRENKSNPKNLERRQQPPTYILENAAAVLGATKFLFD